MKYGVSYYPEHRQEKELKREISLMAEAGINIVRMGEFAWCRFEPEEGRYEFAWLDTVVERLGKVGIDSIICTPTACPPAWLVEKHPGILYVDNRGVTRPFGGRRLCCYSSPIYREYSARIAEEIGRHYGAIKNVFAFQIDNELAQEGTGRCHCNYCRGKFHTWLERKYGTIQNLNEKMGTIFWGQEYARFEQINMPVNTIEVGAQEVIDAYYGNPSLRLEYERFCSESITEYQIIQLNAIRKHTDKIVTTNATGLATNSINYYKAFSELDCYSFDSYPSLRDLEIDSFCYAFARGVKDKSFWLLEFVSGGGHRLSGSGRLQPYPGALKQSVLHAFASGAELLAHFQFRTFPFGAEQLNYAILDADGLPRRRFFEMKQAADELKKLSDFLKKSEFSNKVAVCFDYDVYWATKIKPINKDTFDYLAFCGEMYNCFASLGIGADIISYEHSLDKYKLVVVPAPFVMKESYKNVLKEYVKNGGVLVTTFLAGAKDSLNVGYNEPLPCGMTDLFGIIVGEVEPVFDNTISKISLKLGGHSFICNNNSWSEVLELGTAVAIGTYAEGFRKGQVVASCNEYGKGKAYYLGTVLDKLTLIELLRCISESTSIRRSPFKFEDGVEIIERVLDGKKTYCIFNFLEMDTSVILGGDYTDLLTGLKYENQIKISPKAYAFLY